jgi:hypothetical protein
MGRFEWRSDADHGTHRVDQVRCFDDCRTAEGVPDEQPDMTTGAVHKSDRFGSVVNLVGGRSHHPSHLQTRPSQGCRSAACRYRRWPVAYRCGSPQQSLCVIRFRTDTRRSASGPSWSGSGRSLGTEPSVDASLSCHQPRARSGGLPGHVPDQLGLRGLVTAGTPARRVSAGWRWDLRRVQAFRRSVSCGPRRSAR